MAKKPPILFFDIEAGGLNLRESPVMSISYSRGAAGKVRTYYMPPSQGTTLSRWSARTVWEPLKKQAAAGEMTAVVSEKRGLERFLKVLETHARTPGATIAGWNIGYEATAQRAGVSGFDIPGIMTAAERHGLADRFRKVFNRLQIRDLGREYAYSISKKLAMSELGQVVDPDLLSQARTYATQGFRYENQPEHQIARKISERNYYFSGWKQELVYQMSTGQEMARAHESAADVQALKEIHRKPWAMGTVEEARAYNKLAVRNKLLSRVRKGGLTVEQAIASARSQGIEGQFVRALDSELAAHGVTRAEVAAFGGIEEKFFKVGVGEALEEVVQEGGRGGGKLAREPAAPFVRRALSYLKRHPLALGMGLGVAGLIALKPLRFFSGRDDDYNTIEGLAHGGMTDRADFGSGWLGLWGRDDKKRRGYYKRRGHTRRGYWYKGRWVEKKWIKDHFVKQNEHAFEALVDRGVAGSTRRENTDFGSGFRALDFGGLVSQQTADQKVTEDEWRKMLRAVRLAQDQELVLEILDRNEARRAFNKQLRWRDQAKAAKIKNYLVERESLGAFGSFNPSANVLKVGAYVDPRDLVAQGFLPVELADSDRQERAIGETLYNWLNPKRVEETILHEGLHAIWSNNIDPVHKARFIAEAEEQLGGWFDSRGPDVQALAEKAPTYAQVIRAAEATGKPEYTEWVANEMFAHRGAALAYSDLGYTFGKNPALDRIAREYVQPGPRKTIGARFEKFDPEIALQEYFGRTEYSRALEEQKKTILPKGAGVQFSRERQGDLPTALMGIPIDPRILEFRRRMDQPGERSRIRKYIEEESAKSQAKLGELSTSDFSREDIGRIEAINRKRSDLRSVNLDRFKMEVEDADTIVLKRKGFIPRLKSLFGYGDIYVRLAGIDAPEVEAHQGDPLAPFRIWQDQPAGTKASWALKALLEQQDRVSLIVSEDQKTYGRYLGVLANEEGTNINMELLRGGAVSALPFGERKTDILLREQARAAEETARIHRRGMWSYARYQATHIAQRYIGRTITHNTLTRLDKLSGNLTLGTYASFLNSFGDQKRELTFAEIAQARRVGKALRKTHGPAPIGGKRFSGKDDTHLQIEGLGHEGLAWQMRQALTEFGSGWNALRGLVKAGESFEKMLASKEFKLALEGATKGKQLGDPGSVGSVFEMTGVFRGQEFKFARKIGAISEVEAQAQRAAAPHFAPDVYGFRPRPDIEIPLKRIRGPMGEIKFTGGELDMELFEGSTLRSMADSGRLANEQVNMIRRQAEKLYEQSMPAWQNPDINPSNIMLVPQGKNQFRLGIIDYGQARPVPGVSRAVPSPLPSLGTVEVELGLMRTKENALASLDPKTPFAKRMQAKLLKKQQAEAVPGFQTENTIKGISEGTEAKKMRKILKVPFESAWIKAALKKGVSPDKILQGMERLGTLPVAADIGWMEEVLGAAVKTKAPKGLAAKGTELGSLLAGARREAGIEMGGEFWVKGSYLGEGGAGKVTQVFGQRSGRVGVLKEPSAQGMQFQKALEATDGKPMISPPLGDLERQFAKQQFEHSQRFGSKIKKLFGMGAEAPGAQELAAIDEYSKMYMEVMRGEGKGLHYLAYEAEMQKAARKAYGDIVPEVFATGESSFIQEYAGKQLGFTTEGQSKFLLNSRETLMSSNSPVFHLDLHPGQILRRGARYQVGDWGLAIPKAELSGAGRELHKQAIQTQISVWGEMGRLHRLESGTTKALSNQATKQAARESAVHKELMGRLEKMRKRKGLHMQAMQDASKNAKDSARRHRKFATKGQ